MSIKNVHAMKQAVGALQAQGIDCELLENAKPRMYYGNQEGVCDYVLNLKGGRYDVGFRKNADGGYDPVLDTWGGHVSGQVGAACPLPNRATPEGRTQHAIGRFIVEYNEAALKQAAIMDGLSVDHVYQKEDGGRQIVITVPD